MPKPFVAVRSMTVEMVGNSPRALVAEARRLARQHGMRLVGAELVHETALTGEVGSEIMRRVHTGVVNGRMELQPRSKPLRRRRRR